MDDVNTARDNQKREEIEAAQRKAERLAQGAVGWAGGLGARDTSP